MKLLLDTHFLIWIAIEPGKITAAERALLIAPETEPMLSVLSIWEIRLKWETLDRHGRRKGIVSPEAAIRIAVDSMIALASLHPDDVTLPLDPPLPHRDPFDEMLLVHAKRLGARLLTRDDKLAGHPLALQL